MTSLAKRNSTLFPRILLIAIALMLLPYGARAQELRTAIEDFARDPNWDGFRNRLLPATLPVRKQSFGFSATPHAGGTRAGEIGGTVSRSNRRAYYGRRIAERTLNDPLKVAGKFAVRHAEGGSGMLFGWFHHTSKGWRTPNSLGFRIDGNGGNFWIFYEYGTRSWQTGGGGAFEGDRYQTTPTKPFPTDGRPHTFELRYDPRGADQPGVMTFTIDGKTWEPIEVPVAHKADGATLDRFGLWNVQIGGDALEAYFDDLVVNGEPLAFDTDPRWEGLDNRGDFVEGVIRPLHDVGHAATSSAGGAPGELSGLMFRDEKPAYYAANVGRLSLDDELSASGKVALTDAGSDSGVFFGWFDSQSKQNKQTPEHSARQPNYVAVLIEGPSRIGHYFRPGYATSNGSGKFGEATDTHTPPVIRPDGKVHAWTMHYDPKGAGGRGRITVTLGDTTTWLDLAPGEKEQGPTFDRFGLFNLQAGGHHVRIFFDDLTFSTRAPKRPRG